MQNVAIDNPVINTAFEEPKQHFHFGDEGLSTEIRSGRRKSVYLVPIPGPRKRKAVQLSLLDSDLLQEQLEENTFINQLRERVAVWRRGGYVGITPISRKLLQHWTNVERERRLFFCQLEALETAIYIAEVASKHGDVYTENQLRAANNDANPELFRIAFKMATGSGKTVVMAMLIAWHTLNKLAAPQDRRFSDAFLIVTPGITIRDRLRVLLPNDPHNYYRQLDLVPLDMMTDLGRAAIIITNYHAFKQREYVAAAKLTKQILKRGGTPLFTESSEQMVNRVCRAFGNKRNIIVINDEAHHCYRRKPDVDVDKLTGDERKEAQKRDEEARIWIGGLEAVKRKLGVKLVYDLSATPFFLRGSGYREGLLFPWVVTDFSLMDAIESGIVKVPRVPVDDNAQQGDLPTYRYLWPRIRESLPRKGRGTEALGGELRSSELEGALQSLYSNYEKFYRQWKENTEAQERGLTPPVFIVVCNNTNVSKLVFDYISGYEKTLSNGSTVPVPGKLSLFSNVQDGRWLARPNTILVDSEQLESGEAMSDQFKKIAAHEIEEFKAEYRRRFPGRDAEHLADEDLLREVLNTVGKPGKLGEQVKCVVSVSMLTEGWDANTVTHILGIRAFGTQLLCEQVVGRALRRVSYVPDEQNMFAPEYAEVYGIPFSFINSIAPQTNPRLPVPTTRVRALPERQACAIQFPRLLGYRYDLPPKKLTATFGADARMELSTADVPTSTENAPIVGESSIHSLDDLKRRRPQEVAFLLAKLVLEKYFRQDGTQRDAAAPEHCFDADVQAWLFPQVLGIARRWLAECVVCKDNTFPQLLLLIENAHGAADRIYRAIVTSAEGNKTLMPILRPYDTTGSTHYVDFNTSRATYLTRPDKCHVSHVVLDSQWEGKMAHALETMDQVVRYVKNDHLGFTIPYTHNGEERNYVPDYLAQLDNGRKELLNVIIEVTGERKRDKEAKVATARDLWVPAVNNHGAWGRWAFVEVTDPWDAQHKLRELLEIVLV